MTLGRRGFLGLLFAAPVAVQHLLRMPHPTAELSTTPSGLIGVVPDSAAPVQCGDYARVRRYQYVRMQHRVRQGQLVQHANGSILGVAMANISAGNCGFVQIYGPLSAEVRL